MLQMEPTVGAAKGPQPEIDGAGPVYVEAPVLLETRPNEAQARQRALEISRTLPSVEARVRDATGEVLAL